MGNHGSKKISPSNDYDGDILPKQGILSVKEVDKFFNNHHETELTKLDSSFQKCLLTINKIIRKQLKKHPRHEFKFKLIICKNYLNIDEIIERLQILIQDELETEDWCVCLTRKYWNYNFQGGGDHELTLFISNDQQHSSHFDIGLELYTKHTNPKFIENRSDPQALYATIKNIFPSELCVICQDKTPELILLCGHSCLCQKCYDCIPDQKKNCPICRSNSPTYQTKIIK